MDNAYKRLHDVEGVYAYRLFIEPPKATHQSSVTILRRRDGVPFIGKRSNSDLVRWRQSLETLLRCTKNHSRWVTPPEDAALSVEITSTFPAPQRQKEPYRWKITKPDLDNHAKVILDALQSTNFIWDDCKIAQLILCKRETIHKAGDARPSIDIVIRSLTPPFLP